MCQLLLCPLRSQWRVAVGQSQEEYLLCQDSDQNCFVEMHLCKQQCAQDLLYCVVQGGELHFTGVSDISGAGCGRAGGQIEDGVYQQLLVNHWQRRLYWSSSRATELLAHPRKLTCPFTLEEVSVKLFVAAVAPAQARTTASWGCTT